MDGGIELYIGTNIDIIANLYTSGWLERAVGIDEHTVPKADIISTVIAMQGWSNADIFQRLPKKFFQYLLVAGRVETEYSPVCLFPQLN